MTRNVRLESNAILPDRELRLFLEGLDGEGAVVNFTGLARPRSSDGEEVTGLFLDHYPGMTQTSLERIASESLVRFSGLKVTVVHRIGAVVAGEPIVFVAAAALHRREAFEAAQYVMDRLKTEAVFWKREDRAGGSSWIEPTAHDLSRLGK